MIGVLVQIPGRYAVMLALHHAAQTGEKAFNLIGANTVQREGFSDRVP